MYISELVLVNYRNFKRSRFVFDKDINTIIGENGTGKSNLFRAIRLLLDDEMLYRAYKLGVNDFSHDLDDWRGALDNN
ncbi:recombination protein F [Pluralibacter gergoviae]|nr:recombination protein F [Pluralibacter gergoviae]